MARNLIDSTLSPPPTLSLHKFTTIKYVLFQDCDIGIYDLVWHPMGVKSFGKGLKFTPTIALSIELDLAKIEAPRSRI